MATDPVEEILPDEDEPLSAAEEYGLLEDDVASIDFEDPLDPTTFVDDEATIIEEDFPLGRGLAFDFGKPGHYTVKGRGPLETRGWATVAVWAEKVLHTRKGAHPIYSDDFGVTQPFDLIGSAGGIGDTEDLEVEITEALTFHPRISDVTDFEVEFDEVTEALSVSFTIVRDDDDEMALSGLLLA